MKKVLLSGFVIFTFIGYAVQQRFSDENVAVVTPNTSVVTSQSLNVIPSVAMPTATPTTQGSAPPPQNTPTPTPANRGKYKDGSYTGSVADAFYGNIQVKAVISGGKITDVQFLQYPSDRRQSIAINTQAMPMLKQEAIQAQSAQVDGVSGASASSGAFIQSLQSALSQAI